MTLQALETLEADAGKSDADQDQYVSFEAGGEQYAVDIMSVREITGWVDVTRLPNQPEHVRGVLNLRGAVLPIVDLQCRLGGERTDPTPRHVIVIVTMGDRHIGLLVDAVSDILTIGPDQIKPVPDTHDQADARVFAGFLTDDEHMVAMLDLTHLLSDDLPNELSDDDAAQKQRRD
jgi:purine-binding chemotaxis protein CheW